MFLRHLLLSSPPTTLVPVRMRNLLTPPSYRVRGLCLTSPVRQRSGSEGERARVCEKKLNPSTIIHPPLSQPSFYGRPFPQGVCVDYASAEGKALFLEAMQDGRMNPFFRLAGSYAHQSEPAYCALAVLAMVLNSLQIDPGQTWKKPWRWYSEEMLACCTNIAEVREKGITFDQFMSLASCKGGVVQGWRYSDSSLREFRQAIVRSVESEDEVLVASFNRKDLGQTGSGHFAPVSGYNASSDSVLLLEVARFKYPSHWVPVSVLFHAMQAVDTETGLSRGFLSIRPAVSTELGAEGLHPPSL
eukprot:TRINITY_DN7129_c0_g1_i1.p1 TRINITY_DN7129_c0_g1~~TRINITY_DN7129_c0_g1_i1.p1  ORF type:complete len:314 (+),score=55.39 TRINITY_DN7129_c0_g1_i1:37-942(+)